MEKRIILASGSKQRKLIMDSLGLEYEIIPADIDEKSIRDEDLFVRARKIAKAKAEKVLKLGVKGIVVAADTFAESEGRILEKPENLLEAKKMLQAERNHKIIVYTGFYYCDTENDFKFSKTSVSKLWMRNLSDREIDYFIRNNPVTSWSAAFSPMYLYQTSFIKKVIGSMTSVFGFPTEFLIDCLEKSGIEIKGSSNKLV